MRIAITKEAFNRKISLLTSKLTLNSGINWSSVMFEALLYYGSEIWALRKLEREYLESFELGCWRGMKKIKWPEKVTNEQVLGRIRENRTLLNHILCRKANFIGHILRRNCLLHDTIEGQRTEVKGVGRGRTLLLDDLRNRRRYWELKEEAEDRKRWRRLFINRT